MNSLKCLKDVYYNGHVVSNITMGESGDGQFIYMTGILPLRDKLTVGEAKSACFPTLPRLIAKKFGTKYTEIVILISSKINRMRHILFWVGLNV